MKGGGQKRKANSLQGDNTRRFINELFRENLDVHLKRELSSSK
jgi:hypothetical protein